MVVPQVTLPRLEQEIQAKLARATASTPRPARPLVLVPGFFASIQTGKWPVYAGDAAGMDCLRLAGGSPLSLANTPLIEGEPLSILTSDAVFAQAFEVIWSFIEQVEIRGLYLGGGGDLCSCLYGQSPLPATGEPELWRDVWERYILFFAWLLHWPTLGICRGAQHMNVILGGGLLQDLRTQWRSLWSPYGGEFEPLPLLRHGNRMRLPTPDTMCTHPLLVDPGSKLAALVQHGCTGSAQGLQIDTAFSLHHQAIGIVLPNGQIVGPVASGYRVCSLAHDGVIEGMEASEEERFWLALQFHAEWSLDAAWARGIFSGFIEACQDYTPLSYRDLQELKPAIRSWIRAHDQETYGWSEVQDPAGTSEQAAGRRGQAGSPHLPGNLGHGKAHIYPCGQARMPKQGSKEGVER